LVSAAKPSLRLVVLLEIDAKRVALLKLECDAPRPVYMNGIAERRAPQRVEIEAGNVHLFGTRRSIESKTAIVKCFLNAGGCAPLEQFWPDATPRVPNAMKASRARDLCDGS
jgi:hypothetical protein